MNSWRVAPVSYRGIEEKSAPGTHIACADVIKKHLKNKKKPEHYLELATGNGAFAARMLDFGITEVEAIDLEPEQCQLIDLKVKRLNLNLPFTEKLDHQKYDLITAIEIIEHLDNPRDFVGQIYKKLSDEGLLLVSTPNVEHWLSRLKFLYKGQFRFFSPGDYEGQRHINPLTDFQMRCIFKENDLEVLDSTSAGQHWGLSKRFIFGFIYWPQILAQGYRRPGEVNIYLVRKNKK